MKRVVSLSFDNYTIKYPNKKRMSLRQQIQQDQWQQSDNLQSSVRHQVQEQINSSFLKKLATGLFLITIGTFAVALYAAVNVSQIQNQTPENNEKNVVGNFKSLEECTSKINLILQENEIYREKSLQLLQKIRKNTETPVAPPPQVVTAPIEKDQSLVHIDEQMGTMIESLKDQKQKNQFLSNDLKKLNTALSTLINEQKRRRVPFEKIFDETPHPLTFIPKFKNFLLNHMHYLSKKNIKGVLEIGTNREIRDRLRSDKQFKKLDLHFDKDEGKIFQWVNIRTSTQKNRDNFMNIKRYINKTTEGMTIFYQNMSQWKQFRAQYQHIVDKIMEEKGFVYDEIPSLNLRRRQGQILCIYTKKTIKNNPQLPFKAPLKNYIAIQTVLKFDQNLPYLREWIGYHLHLGVDKFFLYDNNGTEGHPNGKSNSTHNKYYFDLRCLNYSEQRIINQFNQIWDQFYQHIVYVPWQPMDQKGTIVYGHMDSMKDYINNFQDVTAFTGFIDVDQMMFSQKGLDLGQYLTEKSLEGYTSVRFRQAKFVARFCVPNTRMLEMNMTFEVDTERWAEKLFFETEQFYPGPSIHEGRTFSGNLYKVDNTQQWRFNHYNMVEGMVRYSQVVRHSKATKMSVDSSGSRYKEVLDQICQGKCTEKFQLACNLDDPQSKFKCPKFGVEYHFIATEEEKNQADPQVDGEGKKQEKKQIDNENKLQTQKKQDKKSDEVTKDKLSN